MEKSDLKLVLKQFQSAITRLEEALKSPVDKNQIYLDASIQRFEFCYELCWKTLKRFLKVEGIDARTPREVFKESFKLGLLSEGDDLWSQMIKDRSITSHTYQEELAKEIYGRLSSYLKCYQNLAQELSKRCI